MLPEDPRLPKIDLPKLHNDIPLPPQFPALDCRPPSVDVIRRPAFIDEGLHSSDTDLAIEDLVDAANDFFQRHPPRRPSEQLLHLYECVVACAESIDLSDHTYEDITNYITKWNQILKSKND